MVVLYSVCKCYAVQPMQMCLTFYLRESVIIKYKYLYCMPLLVVWVTQEKQCVLAKNVHTQSREKITLVASVKVM